MLNLNRFHFIALLTWQAAIFLGAQMIFGIFSNYIPDFQCGDGPISKNCSEYKRCNGNVTFHNVAFHSAAMEFDWICNDNSYLMSVFSQVQFVGVLIGVVLFGGLSDAFGRRKVSLSAVVLALSMTFLTGFSTSWQMLFTIRFILGLSLGGNLISLFTYVMEVILPEHRIALRGLFNWGMARMMLPIICYFCRDWRSSSFVCAIVASPAFFIVLFLFPESPTWLRNKGRIEEMIVSEKRMAAIAGVEYVPVEHEQTKTFNKTFWEMLGTSGAVHRLLVLYVMWFSSSLCSYANDLNSNSLVGDIYVNQFLFGLLIYISKIILVLTDVYYPALTRRQLHQGSQFIVIICFLILSILTMVDHRSFINVIINILGSVFIEYTWDANQLCAVESMETSCRASATGTCSLVARIGAIIAPLLSHASTIWAPSVYLTVVIVGLVNLFVSYFFLKETKGINLDAVHMNESELLPLEETELKSYND